MNTAILHDCLTQAMRGALSFPETVKRMHETGVERYHADLVTLEKLHYSSGGEIHSEKILLEYAPPIATDFSAQAVKDAIADSQQRRIEYPEFLRRIMSAGTTDYTVYIEGRKAIYNGRGGDFHIEHFPGAEK